MLNDQWVKGHLVENHMTMFLTLLIEVQDNLKNLYLKTQEKQKIKVTINQYEDKNKNKILF